MEKRNIPQKNESNKTGYQTFGGLIFCSDFNTMRHSANMAQRIISDMCFDEQCKRAAQQRDWNNAARQAKKQD